MLLVNQTCAYLLHEMASTPVSFVGLSIQGQ
jgi:hypothetical protein